MGSSRVSRKQCLHCAERLARRIRYKTPLDYSPASNPFRTCQLNIRASVICVPGLDFCSSMAVGCTSDLRQDKFAQPTHPASPSAYSVFPTPNTFLRCRQPCIDLQTKAHNARRCPPYAYKSPCLFTSRHRRCCCPSYLAPWSWPRFNHRSLSPPSLNARNDSQTVRLAGRAVEFLVQLRAQSTIHLEPQL